MGFLRSVLVLSCCRPTLCQVAGEERTDCSKKILLSSDSFIFTIGARNFLICTFSLFVFDKIICLNLQGLNPYTRRIKAPLLYYGPICAAFINGIVKVGKPFQSG